MPLAWSAPVVLAIGPAVAVSAEAVPLSVSGSTPVVGATESLALDCSSTGAEGWLGLGRLACWARGSGLRLAALHADLGVVGLTRLQRLSPNKGLEAKLGWS